jgi:hypothetical protein
MPDMSGDQVGAASLTRRSLSVIVPFVVNQS